MASVPPPGGKPTIKRMVRPWAKAGRAASAAAPGTHRVVKCLRVIVIVQLWQWLRQERTVKLTGLRPTTTAEPQAHIVLSHVKCKGPAMLTSYTFDHPGANMQPGDKTLSDKAGDKLRTLCGRPSTGRTTAQGRKVEKPAPAKQGGPSGQTDEAEHNKKHTNK